MSNSTPRAALPPLPAPKIAYGYAWKVPIAKYDYYTAEQVEQIRRETVQACADAFLAEAATWVQLERVGPLGSVKRQGSKAILALLHVKEPK